VQIKKDLAGINGLVTMMTLVAFIDFLKQYHLINDNEYDEMIEQIRETSPYANGYDIRCDKAKIVAEIKCNAPVKGNAFDDEQMKQLVKDIKGLHNQSLKTKGGESISDYLKFMVLLDEGKHDEDPDNFLTAEEGLISHVQKHYQNIQLKRFEEESKPWDHNTIYIVTIPLTNLELSILT
jgi:hypothetical protein